MKKIAAIEKVLLKGINGLQDGVDQVLKLTGNQYTEDAIKGTLKSVLKDLENNDVRLSKNLLQYTLSRTGSLLYLEKISKDAIKKRIEEKKNTAKKKKLEKSNERYEDDETIDKQNKLIEEILYLRRVVQYNPIDPTSNPKKDLKKYTIEDLESHRNNLIKLANVKNIQLPTTVGAK